MSSRFTTPSCGFWQGWEGARSFVLFAAFALQNQKANARPHLVQLLQRLAHTLLVVIHLVDRREEREGSHSRARVQQEEALALCDAAHPGK